MLLRRFEKDPDPRHDGMAVGVVHAPAIDITSTVQRNNTYFIPDRFQFTHCTGSFFLKLRNYPWYLCSTIKQSFRCPSPGKW